MKKTKMFSILLTSTSSFTLFSSLSFGITPSLPIEDNISYWGRAKNMAGSSVGCAKNFLGSAASTTKSFVVDRVDEKVKKTIASISTNVSELVDVKFNDFLYVDKERHGKVEKTGENVKIYMNQSQAISRLFESATGKSINQLVANLPFGIKQVSEIAKVRLEKAVVNMISDMAIKTSVKSLIEQTLLATYTQSKNIAYNKFTDLLSRSKDKIVGSSSSALPVFEANLPFHDLSQEELLAEFGNSEGNKLNPQDSIVLRNVFNKYFYDIKSFLNRQLYKAIDEIVNSSVSTGIDKAILGTKITTAVVMGPGVALGAAFLAGQAVTPGLKSFSNAQAHKILNPVINFAKVKIGSLDILSVDQEHAGKGTFTEIEDDFLSLDIEIPSFSAYAVELASEGKRKVAETARNLTDKAKEGADKIKATLKEAVKDFDGKAGAQAAASHFQTQFAGPVPTVVWDSPAIITNNPYLSSDYKSQDFKGYVNIDQAKTKTKMAEGTLGKLKSLFSW